MLFGKLWCATMTVSLEAWIYIKDERSLLEDKIYFVSGMLQILEKLL